VGRGAQFFIFFEMGHLYCKKGHLATLGNIIRERCLVAGIAVLKHCKYAVKWNGEGAILAGRGFLVSVFFLTHFLTCCWGEWQADNKLGGCPQKELWWQRGLLTFICVGPLACACSPRPQPCPLTCSCHAWLALRWVVTPECSSYDLHCKAPAMHLEYLCRRARHFQMFSWSQVTCRLCKLLFISCLRLYCKSAKCCALGPALFSYIRCCPTLK
jgi:hypothetical protein